MIFFFKKLIFYFKKNVYISKKKMEYDQVYNFLVESTKHFDESHNHVHGKHVFVLSKEIAYNMDFPQKYNDFLMIVALLHDVCDLKYKEKSISEKELLNFITTLVGKEDAKNLMLVIDNISFSKQVKNLTMPLQEPFQTIRDIVSDADKITAIGKEGIARCFQYTKTIHPNLDENEYEKLVYKHAVEKLSILYPQKYIKTIAGRLIAEPLHNQILEFMKNYETKTDFLK